MKAVLLVLAVIGCSAPSPADPKDLSRVYCTANVPVEQLPYIQAAMTEWNEKTQYTTWSLNGDCDSIIEMVDSIDDNAAMIGKTFRSDNMRIQVESTVKDDGLRVVLLHELGHVAHLEHSTNPNDVMFIDSIVGKHLTDNDLAEFNSINWR